MTLGLGRVEQWARLTVTDTGPGIAPEEQQRIFERFYRIDKARSRSMGGAGLGLAIAMRITQLHGGRLEVTSEGIPGKGSTFSLWLPLRNPSSMTSLQPTTAGQQARTAVARSR